jgi:8-oxo-dGTP pyrophosphatase MutT (NUDIX family)
MRVSNEKSCGVVPVWFDGRRWRFLLIQQKSINWGFPRGHMEAGETEEETARRELAEETGIRQVELANGLRYESKYTFTWGGKKINMHVVYFLGRVSNPKVKPQPEEILDHHWFDFASAEAMLGKLSTANILRKVKQDMIRHRVWNDVTTGANSNGSSDAQSALES